MLPLRVARLIEHSLQPALFSHNIAHNIRHISLKDDLTATRQPAQDMESVGVYACRVRHASVVGQRGLQDDFECLEAPAVAEAEADEVGEAIEDVVVRGNGKDDVFYQGARALV